MLRKKPIEPVYRPLMAAVLAGFVLSLPLAATAETPEKKGLAIAEEMGRRDLGFGDHTSVLSMVLKNRNGETSTRKLDMATLEVPERDRGDKTMIVFNHPRDVKGTAMLTHTKILDPDNQWLFLPALKRVKRISSANKSGPFVGSEFAFEDLASQEVDKYAYRYLRDEACGDMACFVVERKPLYEYSGYTRQVVWIDTAEYRLITIQFYDRKNELLKTLNFNKYKQYLDKYWRSHELVMVNHQTGKSTVLAFDDYRFRTGLRDKDFSKTVLRRQR